MLEGYRCFLAEDLFLQRHGAHETDVANLAARHRSVSRVFGQAECPLDATRFCARQIAADTADATVIKYFHDNLVVGANELELGIDFTDLLGVCDGR